MRGVITTYDLKKGEGRIQAADGLIYFFARKNLSRSEDVEYLRLDTEVEFEPFKDSAPDGSERVCAIEVVVVNKQDVEDGYYREPSEFLCVKEDLVDGYDVLDRGLYAIYRSDRSSEKAYTRLRNECLQLGANAIVSYSVEQKLRNAFGHGYYSYTARGVPVVLARSCADGEYKASELKNRLNQKQIKKNHDIFVNTKIGKMVLKVLAGILLIIFTLGFILTGGL